MKKLLLTLLPVLALAFSVNAQDTLFVEEFDGGIPETWEVGPGDPEGAVWQWTPDGLADSVQIDGVPTPALFWGTRGPIGSATASNGAAMFNSDAYDNGGVAIGEGPFPAPQTATLTSPIVDCSGQEFVFLKWNQYFRYFDAAAILEVSANGGQDWVTVPVPLNDDLAADANVTSGPDDVQFIDVSEWAANNEDFRFRFVWGGGGNYYFWIIDDVVIQTPVSQELSIPDYYFYPPASFAQPESQIDQDTFGFTVSVENIGKDTVQEFVALARILQLDETSGDFVEIFADSITGQFPPFTKDTLTFENLFVPDELEIGEYRVVYNVLSRSADDFNPNNNQIARAFFVTENLFSKENGPTIGFQPAGGGDYEIANYYRMGPAPADGVEFTVGPITSGAVLNEPANLPGSEIDLLVYKVRDGVAEDFSNFAINNKDSLEVLGFGAFTYPDDAENFDLVTTTPTSFTLEPIALEPNGRYFISCLYADDTNVFFQTFNESIDYYQISTVLYQPDNQWFLGGFGPEPAAVIRMELDVAVSADAQQLPENSLKVFPNPIKAGNQISVGLQLEQPQEAQVVIANMDGRVMGVRQFDSLKNELIQMPTTNLPAGNYQMILMTNEGVATKQFIVVQ